MIDIDEIMLKLVLNTDQSINQSINQSIKHDQLWVHYNHTLKYDKLSLRQGWRYQRGNQKAQVEERQAQTMA